MRPQTAASATTLSGDDPDAHRYFHKLYALDVVLPDLRLPDKARLLTAMKDHVLAEAVLIGRYCKTSGTRRDGAGSKR